jgi:hypothetical protein
MTVIAYRHGIMACDSCWATNGTQNVSFIKIIRLSSGALLGSAGDNDCRAIIHILDKIKHPDKLPTRQQLAETKTDYEGLLAFPRGGVWQIVTGKVDMMGFPEDDDLDFGTWPAATMGGYAACGSGGDFALAAMDAGASAKLAVEIACRRSIHCRLPVHVARLHPIEVRAQKHSRKK